MHYLGNEQKIAFIHELWEHLEKDAKILIDDVSFETHSFSKTGIFSDLTLRRNSINFKMKECYVSLDPWYALPFRSNKKQKRAIRRSSLASAGRLTGKQ